MLESSPSVVWEQWWDLDFCAVWLQQSCGVAEVARGVDLARPLRTRADRPRTLRRRRGSASSVSSGLHAARRTLHKKRAQTPLRPAPNSKTLRPRTRTVCSPWHVPLGSGWPSRLTVRSPQCGAGWTQRTPLRSVDPGAGGRPTDPWPAFQIASERLVWPRSMRSSASFAMAGPIGVRDAALSMRCGSPQLRTDRWPSTGQSQ